MQSTLDTYLRVDLFPQCLRRRVVPALLILQKLVRGLDGAAVRLASAVADRFPKTRTDQIVTGRKPRRRYCRFLRPRRLEGYLQTQTVLR